MTERRVRLSIDHDVRVRAVMVADHFAVHRKYSTAGPMNIYTVTHVRTGLACGQRYPSRDVAVAVAELLAALPIKWAEISHYSDIPKRLRNKAICIISRAQLPVNFCRAGVRNLTEEIDEGS